MGAEFYALKIRNAIADKEFAIASANHDLAKFGEWRGDYSIPIAEANREISNLFHQMAGAASVGEKDAPSRYNICTDGGEGG